MRQSQLLQNTLREQPSEADTAGHAYLLRGGYIRQLAAGVYSYLPLGKRVLRRAENIIREEMERAGIQEIQLPTLQPAELWKESGRYGTYGENLMTMLDRHEREFILGPTHEEAVTWLLKNEVSSYRKLPVRVFQIGTKYRDELRPRFGLLRGREFIMKDAYSFDTSEKGLDQSYRIMVEAYHRIFSRAGLHFKAVHADAGTIGGEGGSQEFIAFSAIGEDTVAVCGDCGYAANLEQAETYAGSANVNRLEGDERPAGSQSAESGTDDNGAAVLRRFHTPDIRSIDQLCGSCGLKPSQMIKTLIYSGGGRTAAVLVRGDHEVNELKVAKALGALEASLADEAAVLETAGVKPGYVGPVGLRVPLLVDYAVAEMVTAIAGAGQEDVHYSGVVPGRDFPLDGTGDFRNACVDDLCPVCRAGRLSLKKGIEIGHVFKLGTRYSRSLSAVYLDASGQSKEMIMGCYGIGVSRLLAAVAEQYAGEEGINWPAALAPFDVQLIIVSMRDEAQVSLGGELYGSLTARGTAVLLDDRQERPGVKFKDSGLIGAPYVIVIGREAEEGRVEVWDRSAGSREVLHYRDALQRMNSPH